MQMHLHRLHQHMDGRTMRMQVTALTAVAAVTAVALEEPAVRLAQAAAPRAGMWAVERVTPLVVLMVAQMVEATAEAAAQLVAPTVAMAATVALELRTPCLPPHDCTDS